MSGEQVREKLITVKMLLVGTFTCDVQGDSECNLPNFVFFLNLCLSTALATQSLRTEWYISKPQGNRHVPASLGRELKVVRKRWFVLVRVLHSSCTPYSVYAKI